MSGNRVCSQFILTIAVLTLCSLDAQDLDSALLKAVRKGQTAAVESLLTQGASANAKDREGQTALFLAALKGKPRIVELLVSGGADMSASVDDITALMQAAYGGKVKVTEVLLAHGADANETTSKGMTPLMFTIAGARWKEHLTITELLLDAGADVNLRDENGLTALQWAEGAKSRLSASGLSANAPFAANLATSNSLAAIRAIIKKLKEVEAAQQP